MLRGDERAMTPDQTEHSIRHASTGPSSRLSAAPVESGADRPPNPEPDSGGNDGRLPRRPSFSETFVSLRIRDFRYLSLSTLTAGLAQWASMLALFALVYDMTGSAVQLGSVAAVRGGIATLSAPFGGYLSDRFPRRHVIVHSSLFDAALAAALAAMVIGDVVTVWHVYAFALTGGLAQSINQPARQAFVFDVTTDEALPNAVAVSSMVQNLSRVLGPSAIGVMMAAWGVGSALVGLVILQVIAVAATLRMSRVTRQTAPVGRLSPFLMITEGFTYCWQDKRILGLVVLSILPSLLVYPYIPFLKVVSEEVLHRGNAGYGMLASMMGWGSLGGLLALAYLGAAKNRGRLMIACYITYSTMLIGFSMSSVYPVSLLILATGGIFHSVAMALNNTLLLQTAKDEMRGRVMALNQMAFGVQPLGSFPLAFAVSAWGVQVGIGVFMVTATIAFIVFALSWASVRRM